MQIARLGRGARISVGVAGVIGVFVAACGGDSGSSSVGRGAVAASDAAQPAGAAASPAPAAAAPPPGAAADAASAKESGPPPIWKATGFSTPDCVIYDEAGDRYLVANINGKPMEADNNGYISELSTDGKVTKEKFIAGGENKVTLHAPKGMAISGGVLYVTDIDTLRGFDLKTGAPKSDVKIASASFLNDVAAAPDGKLYVTDTGIKIDGSTVTPTGTDAVYVVDKTGKAKALASTKDLNRPNGIVATDKGVFVNSFGAAELFRIDDKGKKVDVTTLPYPGLDGLELVGDTFWVSSWDGWAIYKGKLGGTFEPAISGLKSPADFAYDKKRNRIVVPLFLLNSVEAYDAK